MKKLALVGGIVAVAVICAVMFMGGGGGVSIGKKTESPFIAKAAVPSSELQKVIKDKKGYERDEAIRLYTEQNPNDASALLLYGDMRKALSSEFEPFGLRIDAASAYWKGMQLGDPECRKRLLWMISPASIRSELNVWEVNSDGGIISGENHPIYRYEMGRATEALQAIDTSTPEGQKQAEEIREWATVVSIISLEDGDVKCAPLFYELLLTGAPSDEDYLMAAYVTIFTDYLIKHRDDYSILEKYEIDPEIFSLDNPKVKEIIDREIKNQTPVGITMEAMLAKPDLSAEYIRLEIASEIDYRARDNKEWTRTRVNFEDQDNKINTWRESAPERIKKLETVYDQLDTIGLFVLGNEYLNCNIDKDYKFTGAYSQKAIDCFKACQKDPYAINRVSTQILKNEIVILPDTEIKKIVESISKEGHGKEYNNPEKSWKTAFEKMENVEWKDISVRPASTENYFWARTILCSGTYQGDKVSIIFPVYYDTQEETWYAMDGWIRVFVNKDYRDIMPMYEYIESTPLGVLLYGEQYGLEGYDRKNPPMPSREVAPWMSEILD